MDVNMVDRLEEAKLSQFKKENTPRKSDLIDDVLDETLVEIVPNLSGPIGYRCKECNVFYPRKWSMKLHIRIHTGEKPYICDYQGCNKAFSRPGSLSEHKRRNHEKQVHHTCPICDKKFYGRSDMLIHIVIHDEARQSQERFLPPKMLKLLNEVEEFNFEGQLIVSNCVCDKCGKIFNKKYGKERHVKSVHSWQYNCGVGSCGKSFYANSGLLSHSKEMHNLKTKEEESENIKLEEDAAGMKRETNEVYKCGFSDCTKSFSTRFGLERHTKTGNHDGGFFFKCSNCQRKFLSSLSLKIHRKNTCTISNPDLEFDIKEEEGIMNESEFMQVEHFQQMQDISESEDNILSEESLQKQPKSKELPYPCDLCENSLSTKEAFGIHKLIHEELNRFTCKEKDCNDVFPNQKSLTQHLKVDHQIEKKYDNRMFHMCDDCGKQCTTKSSLEDHMLKHSKEKNFVCLECGKMLKRRESLTQHMKLHAGVKNYQCDKCEAKYINSAGLRNHTLSKHTDLSNAEQYICSYCGKHFKKIYYLQNHISVHTGEKKYQCNVCQKSFRLEIAFKNHMNMHNGIKNFQCPHCDKKFTQRQQRTVHVRRHTGDKRHKCNMCPMAFIEPRCLRNHLKTHKVQV